jgi:aminopeptidase N
MRIFLLLLTGTFLTFYSYAQWAEDALPGQCREKCGHVHSVDNLQSRTAYFQYPSMNKYDVKYLKLDLAIEANNRNLSGTAHTKALAVQALDSFICELRTNMIIDSVFVNGTKNSGFTRGGDHVFIPLIPAVAAGSFIEVLFYYRGAGGTGGVFAGTVASNGLQYTASLSESYQAREWFPAKQFLADKIDSVDFWITTSNTNMAGSNGKLESTVNLPNNKKQFRWKSRYPMNYYMPSFAVGNYQEYNLYAKPAAMAPDSVLVQNFIVNNATYLNTNKANIDKTPAFIEKLSELYGLYPFKNEKYGHAHANIGGGMEHQTMSTMAGFGSTLIAHELGHQWFGDNVTCSSWNHIWINEGFASYSEYLLIEKLPALFPTTNPVTYMQGIHTNVMSAAGGSVHVPDASLYDENRIFSSRLSYDKGAAIIHTLRFELQNDNTFFQVLQQFQQQYKDKVASAEDFKTVAETISGKNLTTFFNQWYYGEGYPTFNVDYSKQGDSLVLVVNQTTSVPGSISFFKGLYEMRFSTNLGDTTVLINLQSNGQVFKFRSNRLPTGLIVDPNNWVLNKTGSITTGLNSPVNVSNEVKLFPNPAVANAYLLFPAGWFDRLLLVDISGRVVAQQKINTGSVMFPITTPLAKGVYTVQLNGKGRVAVKKLVVQ